MQSYVIGYYWRLGEQIGESAYSIRAESFKVAMAAFWLAIGRDFPAYEIVGTWEQYA